MKKPSLRRSLTFWSGILMMAFICWAWWDSCCYFSNVFNGRHYATHWRGNVELGYDPQIIGEEFIVNRDGPVPQPEAEFGPPPYFLRGQNNTMEQPPVGDELETRKQIARRSLRSMPLDSWELSVPHWLLLLAVVLPWSGLLVWRARRVKRAGEVQLRDASSSKHTLTPPVRSP